MTQPSSRYYVGAALIGMSILILEVTLTRIFAVTMWYYFGFLAVSLALLGIASAGMVVYLVPRLTADEAIDSNLASSALLFGVSAVGALLFHLHITFIGSQIGEAAFYLRMFGQVIVLSLPFFFGGLCLAMLFSRHHAVIARLYCFDLVGSGIGAVLVIGALSIVSGPSVVFLVGLIAAVAALVFRGRPWRWPYIAAVVLFLIALVSNDHFGAVRVNTIKSYAPGQLQVQEPRLLYEKWSPLSRTSVYGNADPGQSGGWLTVMQDAGAPTFVHRYRGSAESMAFLSRNVHKIPLFVVDGSVLVIGSGGGRAIWQALGTGHEDIVALDLNRVVVDVLRGRFAAYSGDPYGQPGVRTVIGEGRSYMAKSDESFDIIELTMVDTWVGSSAGAFMFVENNLYTVEAVRAYRRRLTATGVLAITRYYPFNEALRLAGVISEAFVEDGVERPEDHIAVVRTDNARTATVIAFQQPISPTLAHRLARLSKQFKGALVYAPHLTDAELASGGADDQNFRELLDPRRRTGSRAQMMANFPRDISPTRDDHPFFFYMERDILTVSKSDHKARALAVPILYGLFVSLLILAFGFLIVPLIWMRVRGRVAQRPSIALLSYFACLGVGFMLVEIPLIQKFVLFLGHPTYAFTIILSSILVFGGIGSMLSGRLGLEASPRRLASLVAALVVVLVLLIVCLDWLIYPLLGWPLIARCVVSMLVLAPLALLLGMPFPTGIRILAARNEQAVPWAWAINGAFSVLATVLALVVALRFGFSATLTVGAGVYLAAMLLLLTLRTAGQESCE